MIATTKAFEVWEKAEDLSHKVMARCETAVAEKVEKASRWWQDTKESVKTAVEKTQNFVEKIGNSIKEGLNDCATKAKEGLKCLAEGAKGVWNAVTNFVEEHPLIATGILIVGLAALTFFTGGAVEAGKQLWSRVGGKKSSSNRGLDVPKFVLVSAK